VLALPTDTAELDLAAWSVRNSRTGVVLILARIPARLLALMQGGGIFPLMEDEGPIAPQSSAV
jgi:3-isopropylmalate/(R)-2-methylmalate dehydratase small subunit